MRKMLGILAALLIVLVTTGCGKECETCGSPTAPGTPMPPAPTSFTVTVSATANATASATCPDGTSANATASATATVTVTVNALSKEEAERIAKADLQAKLDIEASASAKASATAKCGTTPGPGPGPGPGPTSWSATKTQTATATATCPSGTTGASVTRSATESATANSSVSQADADAQASAQALAKAQTSAQASANAALVCAAPPVTCTYSVATNAIDVNYRASDGTIAVGASPASCTWTIASTVPWATLGKTSGAGNGSSPYNITENPAITVRDGALTVTGQDGFVKTIPVKQTGKPVEATCSYSVTFPTVWNVAKAGAQGDLIIGVNGPNPSTCTWSITTDKFWVGIAPPSGAGNSIPGNAPKVTIGGNTTGAIRSATVTITGIDNFSRTFTITQGG